MAAAMLALFVQGLARRLGVENRQVQGICTDLCVYGLGVSALQMQVAPSMGARTSKTCTLQLRTYTSQSTNIRSSCWCNREAAC